MKRITSYLREYFEIRVEQASRLFPRRHHGPEKSIRRFNGVVLAGLLLSSLSSASAEPLVHAGDRLVFFGDAITQQRIYTRYVMNAFAAQWPGVVVSFRNAGLTGDGECDRTPGGLKRLERDVLSLQPTWVCVAFGMNDAGFQAFDQHRYDEFLAGLSAIVKELKRHQIRVVLMTPGCVESGFQRNGIDGLAYNAVLRRYADGVKKLAAEENVAVTDVHDLLQEIVGKSLAEKPPVSLVANPVQPAPVLHAAMAFALLRTLQGELPIADAVIDATAGRLVRATRCAVAAVTVQSNAISFVRTDKAIPAWLDPEARSIYQYLPSANSLNRYGLTVNGLAAGDWQLTVAGTAVAVFNAAELAAGVNLAARPGPWQTLGAKINEQSAAAEALYKHIWWDVKTMWWLPVEADAERQRLLERVMQVLNDQDSARSRVAVDIPAWKWTLTKIAK